MARVATEQVIRATVDRAGETAIIDPDALAAVIRLCDSASNRDVVIGVVDRALRRWIDGLDVDRTLAAMTLRARIAAATARHQLIVENEQGDVGSGRGPLTWDEQR
jgi:hypothetical protein